MNQLGLWLKGVTGFPLLDNFPNRQNIGCFVKQAFDFNFLKQPSLLLNGDVIWQASDSLNLNSSMVRLKGLQYYYGK